MSDKIFGLVLAGGSSRRMKKDKALLDYHGQPQLLWAYELLAQHCEETFVSVRKDQHDKVRDALPRIDDLDDDLGPAGGLLAAAARSPESTWLAVACDLPFLNDKIIKHLIAKRDKSCIATAYRSTTDRLPEPLCAIWEPAGLAYLQDQVDRGLLCPRKALILGSSRILDPVSASALENINTPEEHDDAIGVLGDR
ncbi:MAG: NTP transferase domain-containing protein [Gammaproteobacteria bacterium]|nr:NTP transferase domain-containing protein [Gammaproteobacteria bacterium]